MQLVQRTTLLYQSGTSDKVYEVDLCCVEGDPAELSAANRYVVHFRYGRRGKALREGVQTDVPVSLEAARQVFDKLVATKTKKGYRDGTAGGGTGGDRLEAIAPQTDQSEGIMATEAAREQIILARLARGVQGDEGSKPWPLNRVIWRAGELKLRSAAPLLIQLLCQTPLASAPMRNYCLAWALGNCGAGGDLVGGEWAAIAPLEDLYHRCQADGLQHVRRIALAAMLKLATPERAKQWRSQLVQALPEALKELAIQGPAQVFCAALGEDLQTDLARQPNLLETLYHINLEHTRPGLLEVLQTAPFRPPYFQGLRHVFKLAEYNQDAEVFGILAHRFEREEKGHRSNRWAIATAEGKYISRYHNQRFNSQTRCWEYDENPEFINALSGPNAQVAFSEKTKDYLRRRVWRSLKKLGDLGEAAYVALATEVLLQYADTDAQATRTSVYYRWDVNWRRTESGRAAWDQYAHYLAFNHILYTHSPRYSYKQGTQAWRCQGGYEPGGPLPTEREEAFPKLWQQQPEALLRLLLESRCQPVHEFAVRALRYYLEVGQPELGDGLTSFGKHSITLDQLIQLLRQPYAITAEFAFEQVRDRYQADDPNFDLLLAVANCRYSPARAAAYGWIAAQRDRVLGHAPFVAALIVSPEAETRTYARQFLSSLASLPELLSEETARLIVGQAIAILLVLEAGERLQDAIQTLEQCFRAPIRSLGLDVILDLLRHALEALRVFGATLLLNHATPAADLPNGLLDALMESPTDAVRVIGVQLLGRLPDQGLMRKPELLIVLATHPLSGMREAIRPTLVRLLGNYPEFCDRFLPLLLLELQRPTPPVDLDAMLPETEASDTGVQDFLIQLLGQEVTHWMASVTMTQTWQLLEAASSAAQELAGHILQARAATWHEQLSTAKMGELTHHEIQTVRSAGCQMLQHGLPRLRSNPDELLNAVIALESPWEDARTFGFQLFTEQLQPEDFTPSLIVSICDNNLPDIRKLGRDLLSRCFRSSDGPDYLLRFSEHPAQDMQLFATNYLERYAADRPDRLQDLQPYFTIVLGQVNRNRVAKQRIFRFLAAEATKGAAAAQTVAEILGRQSAAIALRDKSQAIEILLSIRQAYPDIATPIQIKPARRKNHAI